jgi:hypothetical protein
MGLDDARRNLLSLSHTGPQVKETKIFNFDKKNDCFFEKCGTILLSVKPTKEGSHDKIGKLQK